jgi:hypothetical protein
VCVRAWGSFFALVEALAGKKQISPEHREKIKAALTARPKGPFTAAHRRKIGRAMKRLMSSEAARQKISASLQARASPQPCGSPCGGRLMASTALELGAYRGENGRFIESETSSSVCGSPGCVGLSGIGKEMLLAPGANREK